ncbi:ParA family protein [Chitinimonas sp. BJB300]|uniref:ParA family protein n=1 Tax=Chitinimonas sp. BJB300 TaxID=1559339 RepID=UPI000C0E1C55|nr:ParA family protein [Chitinimonas sp. BJB300]PHV12682.1 chromosome partitioning protein [Chitinimonas sp. BJB300]TSJ91274.1 ParA family protein [Chitinimonas sp. BJB300]
MSRVIAITNQKGGVGKTTTTVNLSAGLVLKGKRVLLIDLDPQGNATMGSGVDKQELGRSVYHLLLGHAELADVRINTEHGFDILPANRELGGAEVELIEVDRRELRLREALLAVQAEYDYILIDCPPALNMLTVNGLAASDGVIIPMQCEYYALEGLTDLINTMRRVRQALNPKIEIDGLLRTLYDPRSTLAQQVVAQLNQHFGYKVFETVIPRNIRLAEAPSFGRPIFAYDKSSRGAQAYRALAEELIARFK